jgi:hypothetical protein
MRKLTIVLFVSLLWPGLLWGQRTSSTLSGTVTDPSGAVIPEANVTATQVTTGAESKSVSDSHGYYILNNLAPGEYTLKVTKSGFQTYAQPGIILRVNQPATVNVALTVGSEKQTVTVTAVMSQVNTVSSTVSTQLTPLMARTLPLNGRNIMQLMALAPDAGPGSGSGYYQSGDSNPNTNVFVSASGGRGDSVNYFLDGALNEDAYTNIANAFPNPDAIQEFGFETNNYSAKFGGRGGGVMNAVTKSGVNHFHGSAFEYLRYFSLNARNFFSPTQDSLKRNQYGLSIGGPIQKDKTFFFFSYQGTALRTAPSGNTAYTPTANQRNGDFSDLCPGGFDANGLCPAGHGKQLYQPGTTTPYLNNHIDPATFDPIAKKLFAVLPVGAEPDGKILYKSSNPSDDKQFVARLDHNFGNKLRIYGSYNYDGYSSPNVPNLNDILTAGKSGYWRSQTGVLNLAYTVSPRFLTTLAGSISRRREALGCPAAWSQFGWTQLGVHVPELLQGRGNGAEVWMADSGYFSISCGNALVGTPSTVGDVANNWTYARGSHTLEFGGEWTKEKDVINSDSAADGYFEFTQSFSGNNLVDFMLGKPSYFQQYTLFYGPSARTLWGAYITDNWKATRKLTLTLGVRWNPFIPYEELTHHQSLYFDPQAYSAGTRSTLYPNLPPGYFVPGDPGVPMGGIPRAYDIFDPRIGFAYDLFGNGKTSIRGGFGMFTGQQAMNVMTVQMSYPPWGNPGLIQYTIPSMTNPYGPTLPTFPPFPPSSSTRWAFPFSSNPYQPGLKPMMIEQWNLTVEQQLPRNLLLRVGYEGSHTYHQYAQYQGNAAVYNPALTPAQNLATTQARRPMSQYFSSLPIVSSIGTASFNALTTSLVRQMGRGLTFIGGYRWSKCLNDKGEYGQRNSYTTPNGTNRALDWGPCTYDVGSRLSFSYVYEFPSFSSLGPARHLLGGWQSAGILTWQSGYPIAVGSGLDNSFTGIGADRADVTGDPNLPGNRSTEAKLKKWFNTAAFTTNAYGTFGTAARGLVRGPGYANFDFSMIKSVPIPYGPFKESQHLEFRAEFFNLFNHPNFGMPGSTVTSTTSFGKITSASDPRILQFALKYVF